MDIRPTVAIHTLGCKLNQAESESLGRRLSGEGYNLTSLSKADIFIINTCTVTHVADRKSRHLVRLLRGQNPSALILVTGCYAHRAAGELEACGADVVLNNSEKVSIADMLRSRLKEGEPCPQKKDAAQESNRIRSFIKIQDGCQNYCSYCIVPQVRSDVYSVPADDVLREIRARAGSGFKEVVLTGTEISAYDDGRLSLKDLLERILIETEIPRLHLSSLQPQAITSDLLKLWQDPRLCRHFHIALQSGSDDVLKRMRRRYDTAAFGTAVDLIRGIMPDASVTTDIMVGFPGETDDEFRENQKMCYRMKFAAIHVFAYSARPGTLAAGMPGRVGDRLKKQRSLIMLDVAESSAVRFAKYFIGQTKEILWENELKPGCRIYSGLTDNYIRVYTGSGADITNRIMPARLLQPANEVKNASLQKLIRKSHGELWSEVIE